MHPGKACALRLVQTCFSGGANIRMILQGRICVGLNMEKEGCSG